MSQRFFSEVVIIRLVVDSKDSGKGGMQHAAGFAG